MKKLIDGLLDHWVREGLFPEEDKDVYQYGLELLISSVVNICILLVLAFVYGKVIETLIVLAIMLPLQSFAGGYHAKSHLRCFLTMLFCWFPVMWMINVCNKTTAMIALCVALVTIFTLAPVQHVNVNLSSLRERKMKLYSRLISLAVFVLSWVLLFISEFTMYYGIIMSVTMSFLAFSIMIAYLTNRARGHSFQETMQD